jgi:uncharacterized protein (TIGR03086 family)
MLFVNDRRPLHRRALDDATALVDQIGAADLGRPTPCSGWDVSALLTHMIGQHHGFAEAVESGDAPKSAYSYVWTADADLRIAWAASVDRIKDAFAAGQLEDRVKLVEINETATYPLAAVVGFHLLDTTVHAWDLATALGQAYRPDDDLVDATYAAARQVPSGKARTQPGAAFAPPLTGEPDDPWLQALALLGRRG